MKHSINCRAVVGYMEPVANLHTVPVNREVFFFKAVINHEGYKFFGKLAGTVIIAAPGYINRHAECFIICSHNHVSTCLGSRIGAVWHKGHCFRKHACLSQGSIYLIRRNLEEFDILFIVPAIFVIRVYFPVFFGSVKKYLGSDNICC